MSDLAADDLLNIGFVELGAWIADEDRIAYHLFETDDGSRRAILGVPNALYAFVEGDIVRYIGKTTRGIRKRFVGYCRPGARQRTNLRCHAKIKEAIRDGRVIRILAFTPISQLRYGEFDINLAAGLEDSLIQMVNPSWNGGDRGAVMTETAEREILEDGEDGADPLELSLSRGGMPDPIARFTVTLGPTYYERGIVNPGAAASAYLGGHDDPIVLLFSDGAPSVASKINRTANPSGAVRIVGGNRQIAVWFQRHFRLGDTVLCEVLDSHAVKFCSPK